jgi:hypothetical protein
MTRSRGLAIYPRCGQSDQQVLLPRLSEGEPVDPHESHKLIESVTVDAERLDGHVPLDPAPDLDPERLETHGRFVRH